MPSHNAAGEDHVEVHHHPTTPGGPVVHHEHRARYEPALSTGGKGRFFTPESVDTVDLSDPDNHHKYLKGQKSWLQALRRQRNLRGAGDAPVLPSPHVPLLHADVRLVKMEFNISDTLFNIHKLSDDGQVIRAHMSGAKLRQLMVDSGISLPAESKDDTIMEVVPQLHCHGLVPKHAPLRRVSAIDHRHREGDVAWLASSRQDVQRHRPQDCAHGSWQHE